MAAIEPSVAERDATVRIPLELREELEQLARENERSLAGECRVAMREHLARQAAGTAERANGLAR